MPKPDVKLQICCPNCGWSDIRTIEQGTIRWCRRCGYRSKATEFEAALAALKESRDE